MILQSLVRYYDILVADQETSVAPPGFSAANVSYAIALSREGELTGLLSLFEQVPRGKKMVDRPRRMVVPQQVKRSSGVQANFLCDNCAYVLGISDRDGTRPDYSRTRFEAFRAHNLELLAQAEGVPARAIRTFLENHDPGQAHNHPEIHRNLETLLKGGNVVFTVDGSFAHEDQHIQAVWKAYKDSEEAEYAQCLVTGETAPIERLHASLRGIRDANPTGATLVGFNASAYESYNRAQGMNAPVSRQATFAYTTALNYLLSRDNENPVITLGDTTVVYWAESENKAYRDVFIGLFDPTFIEVDEQQASSRDRPAERRLKVVAAKVKHSQPLDVDSLMDGLDPTTRFYVLGLAPNAARVSVRFFHADLFAHFIEQIMRHYQDLSMVKEFDNQRTYLTVRDVVDETVSMKASNPTASPLLAGAIFRAILTGAPYPAGLYSAVLTRIRADQDQDDPQKHVSKIGYERAAILKAYLLRKYRNQPDHPIQEVLQMALNEGSKHPAYLLGRLFAVLEKAQQEAIPGLNTTIKDRYFTTACASPASVFPVLLRLAQHHISKAQYGYVSDRRIQDILNLLDVEDNPIPTRLNLDGQGVFVLGYYHQRAAFYRKHDVGDAAEAPLTDNQRHSKEI